MTIPLLSRHSLALAAQSSESPTFSEALDFLTTIKNDLVSCGAHDVSMLDATVYSLKDAHTLVYLRDFKLEGYPVIFLDVMNPKEIVETPGEKSLKGTSLSIGIRISDELSPKIIDAVVACNVFPATYGNTPSSPLQFKREKASRQYQTTEYTWLNRNKAAHEFAGLLMQYGSSDLTRQLRAPAPQSSAPKPL